MMRFEEALKALREGKIVRRASWSTDVIRMLDGEIGVFDRVSHHRDGYIRWRPTHDEILANNWEIINP